MTLIFSAAEIPDLLPSCNLASCAIPDLDHRRPPESDHRWYGL
jgi:hypothetical protein